MLLFNLRIAWRNIKKNKAFSAINILGLALSIACCLLISMYVWKELNHDRFHSNASAIYRITEKQNQAGELFRVAVTPGPLAPALAKDFSEVKETVRIGSWSALLKHDNKSYEENSVLLTENSLFDIFDFELVKGNPTSVLKNPDEIVITEKTAEKYFGKNWSSHPDLLGQIFTMDSLHSFKLSGIVRNVPENSSIQFDIILPLAYLFESDKWSNNWNSNNFHSYLQLHPQTNVAAFSKKFALSLQSYNPGSSDTLQLQAFTDQYLHSSFDFNTDWGKRSDIKYVRIFSGVGILLLIIACVNFVNLSTARSLKRSLEVGVRKVNGANRKQLILQFLGESLLISAIAGVTSILMIKLGQPYVLALTGADIEINYLKPEFISAFFGIIFLVGILGGLYPAFFLSAFNPVRVLKGNTGTNSRQSVWKSLVVFQFTICITLMIAAAFMYKQLRFLQSKDLGFNKEQLISVRLKGKLMENALSYKRDLEREGSIAVAVPATMSLVNVNNSSYLEWEGMNPEEKLLITHSNITPDFIPALGLKLVAGTNFSAQVTNDTSRYILNETAVRRMGLTPQNVLGRKVSFWGAKGQVIGVVNDFHFKPLNSIVEPFILRYQPKDRYFTMLVRSKDGKTTEAIAKIETLFKKYEADFAPDYRFVGESLDKLYEGEQRTANIILLFTILTVLVGCLGLFGLTVFAAERRRKEIGIRKILGAGLGTLAAILSRDFVKLILLACFIAIPVAWYVVHLWLNHFAFRIQKDWWIFAGSGLGVTILATLTICIHSLRSALSNPVNSLRAE